MDNNKNRLKDRPKSKAEMRKMYFEHGSELGIENGLHIGAKDSGCNKTKTQKLYHKVKKMINSKKKRLYYFKYSLFLIIILIYFKKLI